MLRFIGVAIFCLGVIAQSHPQQPVELLRERLPEDRPALLVLGTGHFANPGRDLVNHTMDDVLSERRQREIDAVVTQLAAFKPTHIAVEWPADRQDALDTRYKAYRAGQYTLTRNEIDQIALRLAARLNLDRVIAADWNKAGPGDEALYNWPQSGIANGQADLVAAITDPKRMLGDIALKDQALGAWLRALNAPQALAASHRNYFDIAMVGEPGATWVGHWYARNLRIFANLERATAGGNRIVALYGAGHAYLLTQFAAESGAFTITPVSQVLKE